MIAGTFVCSSFKRDLLEKRHDFLADDFRIALYDSTAAIGADTTVYVTEGEVTGTGYTQGGQSLLGAQVLLDPVMRVAYATFNDAIWDDSVLVARGAMIYNQSAGQRAVAVLDFGADRTSNHGPFRVQFPPPNAATGLIRVF